MQDVFSLGCTIAELFLDGRTVMDLGQLLGYSRGEWDPAVQVCYVNVCMCVVEVHVCGKQAHCVMDLGQLLGYSRGGWDPAVQVFVGIV